VKNKNKKFLLSFLKIIEIEFFTNNLVCVKFLLIILKKRFKQEKIDKTNYNMITN